MSHISTENLFVEPRREGVSLSVTQSGESLFFNVFNMLGNSESAVVFRFSNKSPMAFYPVKSSVLRWRPVLSRFYPPIQRSSKNTRN